MKIQRPAPKQQPETIVALIDVVFFLLVFFMLIGRMDATAPFDVTPPTAITGADMPSGGITLSIGADGQLALDGIGVSKAELEPAITARLADEPNTLVRINAHRDVELRFVMPLVGQMEGLGVGDVVLVVTPETSVPIE